MNFDVPSKQPGTGHHCQHYRHMKKHTQCNMLHFFSDSYPAVAQMIAELVANGITDVDLKKPLFHHSTHPLPLQRFPTRSKWSRLLSYPWQSCIQSKTSSTTFQIKKTWDWKCRIGRKFILVQTSISIHVTDDNSTAANQADKTKDDTAKESHKISFL